MKTLPSLLLCLVLSLSTAGQALAQNIVLPVSGLNAVLHIKINQDISKRLGSEGYNRQRHALQRPGEKDRLEESGTFTMPDCLCHLYSRVF